ncbi:MAG: ABC transporter ATP-binding protein [Helicobacteraceae bacterium]|jgi:sulfonate transport system ATP-binding protein|nr:ABC transporter ATP-binding protein [Helicobacteraceae bacterium]
MSKLLAIDGVSKSFALENGGRLDVISRVSFAVEKGEFVSIVGPSGCGKTTLLRLIVGLDGEYEGEILLRGERILGAGLERGIVFQDHRLLPWLRLEENVAIALLNAPRSKADKIKAVKEHVALVGLSGFEKSYPRQLSGGMAQRAAIARGLVNNPEILALDEPFGSLDAITRMRLQEELKRIWGAEKTTMILVTHDVEEATFLSDRIFVMDAKPGRIIREIAVDLPEPRDRSSPSFGQIKRRVFEALRDGAIVADAKDNYEI